MQSNALAFRTDAPASSSLSDEAVIERVNGGDVALFEVLMRRHNQRVYRAVRSVVHDEVETEEVMAQTYFAAYTHLREFAGNAKFSTWLVKIAVNTALGRRRGRARLSPLDDDPAEPAGRDPEDRAASRELAALVESSIDRLPGPHRSVLILREIEGLDTRETAEVLGVSEDLVKTRLFRARAALREQLEGAIGGSIAEAFTFGKSRCDRVVARVLEALTGASS